MDNQFNHLLIHKQHGSSWEGSFYLSNKFHLLYVHDKIKKKQVESGKAT